MDRALQVRLTRPDPKPFVKWAGGKGALLSEIAARIPRSMPLRRYVEPFVGAGALFFWIRRSFPDVDCRLADSNEELVNAYRSIRDGVERVIAKLETHESLHEAEHYYRVRRASPLDSAERAARFIYLNRTCYNGLYRVNRRGAFNVPIGRYDRPRIVDRENLLAVATALEGVEIEALDFECATMGCASGDLVYLDPPYHPISETSTFTSYTRDGFGREEQRRLARVFEALSRRGASVILSNSSTAFVRELYENVEPRPAIDEVEVSRAINSKGARRGPVPELLISSSRVSDGPWRPCSP
ncbi:MAG: DNA adenine methylase [Vicinamibacteria bacterium]